MPSRVDDVGGICRATDSLVMEIVLLESRRRHDGQHESGQQRVTARPRVAPVAPLDLERRQARPPALRAPPRRALGAGARRSESVVEHRVLLFCRASSPAPAPTTNRGKVVDGPGAVDQGVEVRLAAPRLDPGSPRSSAVSLTPNATTIRFLGARRPTRTHLVEPAAAHVFAGVAANAEVVGDGSRRRPPATALCEPPHLGPARSAPYRRRRSHRGRTRAGFGVQGSPLQLSQRARVACATKRARGSLGANRSKRTGDLPGTARIGEPGVVRPVHRSQGAAAVTASHPYHAAGAPGSTSRISGCTPHSGANAAAAATCRCLAGSAPPVSRAANGRCTPRHGNRCRGTPLLLPDQVRLVLDLCSTQTGQRWSGSPSALRDRQPAVLDLHETGRRLGEALGMRHHDWHIGAGATPWVKVVPRQDHPHRARAKSLLTFS